MRYCKGGGGIELGGREKFMSMCMQLPVLLDARGREVGEERESNDLERVDSEQVERGTIVGVKRPNVMRNLRRTSVGCWGPSAREHLVQKNACYGGSRCRRFRKGCRKISPLR